MCTCASRWMFAPDLFASASCHWAEVFLVFGFACVDWCWCIPRHCCWKWRCFAFRLLRWVAWSRVWTGMVSEEASRVNCPVWIARVVLWALTWIPRSASIPALVSQIHRYIITCGFTEGHHYRRFSVARGGNRRRIAGTSTSHRTRTLETALEPTYRHRTLQKLLKLILKH